MLPLLRGGDDLVAVRGGRRADQDSVDILALDKLLPVSVTVGAKPLHGRLTGRLARVGRRDDPQPGDPCRVLGVHETHAAEPDHAHTDVVVACTAGLGTMNS